MGLYADLSPEDKAVVEGWEKQQRAWFNSMARLLVQGRALKAAIDASGGPRDIVTGLDAGQEIPNTSGLSGAHPMTKAEWATLIALLHDNPPP